MRIGNWITLGALLTLCGGATTIEAQQAIGVPKGAKPQAGKDVGRVPTSDALARRMLELAKVGPKDYVVDLDSGDGRTVIVAARDFGVRAMGVASELATVESLRKAAAAAGVASRAQFRRADIFATEFATDFSSATVVTMSLLPEPNLRLRPQLLEMKPGTRVVALSYDMGDWVPDDESQVDGRKIYMWTVPAKVGGGWTIQQPDGRFELTLTQNFQKLQARATGTSGELQVIDLHIQGNQISFVLEMPGGSRREYVGRVSGRQMQGSMTIAGETGLSWSAARK